MEENIVSANIADERDIIKMPSYDMSGKVVVITGGTRGIGYGISKMMTHFGAKVVIASRSMENCNSIEKEIIAEGGTCITVPTDVSKQEDVDNLIAAAVKEYGRIDVFISNAGVGGVIKPAIEHTLEEWTTTMDNNLKSVFMCNTAAARQMIKQGGGGYSIISTASISGMQGKLHSAYGASKEGIRGLTRAMAVELGPYDITVNCICPGHIYTDLLREAVKDPAIDAHVKAKSPLNKYGMLDECAPIYLFLASSAGRFITGSSIILDGGQTVKGQQ